jgi:hypothetical protein
VVLLDLMRSSRSKPRSELTMLCLIFAFLGDLTVDLCLGFHVGEGQDLVQTWLDSA